MKSGGGLWQINVVQLTEPAFHTHTKKKITKKTFKNAQYYENMSNILM